MELMKWIIFVMIVRESAGRNSFKGCLKMNTYGYPYLQFYPVELLSKTPPEGRGPQDSDKHHYIEFYVKCQSNARIFMGESKTKGYEIILGGRNNNFSQIRLLNGIEKRSMETRKTEGIVSDMEYRGFWVECDSYGVVMVGTMNSSDPILKWRDSNPIKINTVSFSTWANVLGKWHFACSNTSTPGISDEDEDPILTANQRLKSNLLSYYIPSNFPQKDEGLTENIELHLEASYIHLSEKCGQLEFSGMTYVKWKDWKLTWNKTYYDNITVIHVTPGEIWTPNIYTINSIAFEKKSLLSRRRNVVIKNDGVVTWRTHFHSITYCVLEFKNWPLDTHECFLKFGLLTEPIGIDVKSMILSKISGLKWELQVVNNTNIDKYYVIQIHLRRRDEHTIRILMIPSFLSAAVLSLLSFVISPTSSAKIVFNCLSLLLLILTVISLSDDLPIGISPVPKIVHLYSWSIIAMCIPILLFISLRYIPPKIHLPKFLSELLNTSLAQIFCFSSTTAEVTSQNEQNANDSVRLCVLIERIVFLIYFTTLVLPFATLNLKNIDNHSVQMDIEKRKNVGPNFIMERGIGCNERCLKDNPSRPVPTNIYVTR